MASTLSPRIEKTDLDRISYLTANQGLTDILSEFIFWQSCSDIASTKVAYDTSSIFVTPSGNMQQESICEKLRITALIGFTGKTTYVFVLQRGINES